MTDMRATERLLVGKRYERRLLMIDQHMAIARAIAAMPETTRRPIEWGMTVAQFAAGLQRVARMGWSMKDFR